MIDASFFENAFAESQEQEGTPSQEQPTETPQAVDNEAIEEAPKQVEEAPATETPAAEEKVEEPVVEQTQQTEEPTNDKIKIGDEEFTLEQIKEFRQGYLRQSDYTKKTQELADMRKELEANKEPQAEVKQDEVNDEPVNNEMLELKREIQSMKLDKQIDALKEKYKNFDEIKVLEKANELGITDLEAAYKIVRPDIDINAIKQSAKEAAMKELRAELEANKTKTTEKIVKAETTKQPTTTKSKYSDEQMKLASLMGVSLEDTMD